MTPSKVSLDRDVIVASAAAHIPIFWIAALNCWIPLDPYVPVVVYIVHTVSYRNILYVHVNVFDWLKNPLTSDWQDSATPEMFVD